MGDDSAPGGSDAPPGPLLPEGPPAKLGKPIVFAPSTARADAAVIWLHGFGDKPDGWAQLLRPLRRAMPQTVKWVHLRASALAQPCYKGVKLPGWGPFFSTECIHVGGKDYEDADEGGVYAASVRAVHAEIARLKEEGVPTERMILAGFSQGGAVALESVLCYAGKLAGCAALSCWLSSRARAAVAATGESTMPILVCHGTKDDMVGFDCGEAGAKALRTKFAVDFERIPGLQHSSCPKELRAVANFVHRALGGAGDLRVPEWEKGGAGFGSDDEAVGESEEPEVFYVGREALEALRAKLAAGGAASEGDITALFAIDDLAEAAPLAPLGADVLGEDFDDPEEALKRLGAKATAERLLAASTSEDAKRAKAMTAGEFREMLDADDLSSGEGEEEALESEDSEVSVEHPEKRRKQ